MRLDSHGDHPAVVRHGGNVEVVSVIDCWHDKGVLRLSVSNWSTNDQDVHDTGSGVKVVRHGGRG